MIPKTTIVQAIVLVGGEGTRLRPLTYGTPKPMVPIVNVPFLARTMQRLYEAGIRDVILPAGYLPEAIKSYFGDGARLGMKITYVIEETPLGTAGALKNVEQHITGPFFVLNGDVLTSLDFGAMIAYHKEKGGAGVIHLIKVEDPSAFGCVVHDQSGRVSAFVEKPPRDQAPTNEINAGTYLLERSILDKIPPGRNVSIERETFPQLLAEGTPLYAYT
ncbi:MAG: nucleotidyltransferase family protein, partial [Candidatus Eremiobacteraeota bacterium]|nr:nucleotidyltransferase family protein [Candidatus Eremiobacteraeota bacterium]